MTKADGLLFLTRNGPGRTERELAKAYYGPRGIQQSVNQEIAILVRQGKLVKRGKGGPADPYRIYLS